MRSRPSRSTHLPPAPARFPPPAACVQSPSCYEPVAADVIADLPVSSGARHAWSWCGGALQRLGWATGQAGLSASIACSRRPAAVSTKGACCKRRATASSGSVATRTTPRSIRCPRLCPGTSCTCETVVDCRGLSVLSGGRAQQRLSRGIASGWTRSMPRTISVSTNTEGSARSCGASRRSGDM